MSGLDIEAIRERYQRFEDLGTELSPSNYRIVAIAARSAGDVPVLLAEVEQMQGEAEIQRADIAHLQNELDEEKAAGTACRGALADALQVIADLRGGTS